MLVGRCIPRDTRRYGIAFSPISFYILLSRLFGQADRCIENPEPAECTLFCVSGSSVDEASTRADWTLPAPFGLQFAICFTT